MSAVLYDVLALCNGWRTTCLVRRLRRAPGARHLAWLRAIGVATSRGYATLAQARRHARALGDPAPLVVELAHEPGPDGRAALRAVRARGVR